MVAKEVVGRVVRLGVGVFGVEAGGAGEVGVESE